MPNIRLEENVANMNLHLELLDYLRKRDIESARKSLRQHIDPYITGVSAESAANSG